MDSKLIDFKKCDIFTPDNISKQMSNLLYKSGNILEPSVGTGNLLKFIDTELYDNIDIYDIKQSYLNKCIDKTNINKFCIDFLKHNIQKKYKNIILNPPYIKIQDLSIDYINFIKNKWEIFSKGNIDIYYVFLYKCLQLLDDDGIMVSITPNSYLFNKSSLLFRKYLIQNKYIDTIIDFNSEKVFKNVSVYCCITVFTKKCKDFIIYNNEKYYYNNIDISSYNILNHNLQESKCLGDICYISNGIATLRNNIYINDYKLFDEDCWKKILTPKGLKYIIYPYYNNKIIPENKFKHDNPLTYKYLSDNKNILSKRDKGKKKYETWYAYGRKQGIKSYDDKNALYIPVFCDINKVKLIISKPMLYISFLMIRKKSDVDIKEIKNIIEKNRKYIYNNSSKRGGGWINVSSRVIKSIKI